MSNKTTSYVMIVLAVAMMGAPSASAGLLISVEGLTQSAGSGSFEVTLSNTNAPGGTTYDVAGFTFELIAAPGSGLTFTAADYPAGAIPYIFEGVGQTTLDPTIPLSYDSFPTADVNGADSAILAASVSVASGDKFSLGLVSFASAVPVLLSEIQSMIVRSGTSLSDENFDPIPYTLPNAAVPEPSSLVLTGLAAGLVLGAFRVRRR